MTHEPHEHIIPPLPKGRQRIFVYPWQDLLVGDWFVISTSHWAQRDDNFYRIKKLANDQEREGRKFQLIAVDDGVRVYRVK